MKKDNPVRDKSYQFALRIVKLYRYLAEEKKEYILSKQLLRSGTSIGANVEEALGGQSRKEFITKITISYKEARETVYWIRLLRDSGYLTIEQADSILKDADVLLRLLGSIQLSLKNKPE